MAYEGIPIHVEKEIGSDGEETGKFVFVANDLQHYYHTEFDPERMEWQLEEAGYQFREFRPMLREMERQYEELTAAPADEPAAAPAKKQNKPDPTPQADPPPPAE